VITSSPIPSVSEMGTLLRELNHRINSQLAAAINLISLEAVRAEGAEAKASLSSAVELLHGCAEVHRALRMPEPETLIDAGVYVRRLCSALTGALLNRLTIELTFKGETLPLQPQRCWRLGLIVNELVTNVAKHARFEARSGHITIKLAQRQGVVNCVVADNGSASPSGRQGQGLRIVRALARSLGGRIELGLGANFRSVVLSFQLTERERKANEATASRHQAALREAEVNALDISAPRPEGNSLDCGERHVGMTDGVPSHVSRVKQGESASRCRPTDSLGVLLSARTA